MSKNNTKYWQGRAEQRLLDSEQKILRYENEMQGAFNAATKDLELQIHKLYAKYATDNELTYAEAKKYLTNSELAEFKKDLEYYIEKASDGEYRKEYRAYLQALSTRARVSRIEALIADIKGISHELYQGTLLPNSTQLMGDIFDEAYNRAAFDFSKYARVMLVFSEVSRHKVNALLEYPWSGKNFTQKWNAHCNNFDAVLEEVMTKGLIQGKSPQAIARELSQRTSRSYKDAIRLVRTEGNFIHNSATASMYEQMGVEQYIYLATLDLRTSSMCRELDNKVFDLKDKNVGVNYPPLHAHCRSTTIPNMDDGSLQTRIARDPVTGKNIKVPANMAYKQWHEKYVAGNEEATAKEKMLKNKTSDKQQHNKYRAIFGNEIPRSLEKFQEIKYNDVNKWNEIKARKQEALNGKDFSEMKPFIAALGNKESRLWYKAHDERIGGAINTSKPIEEQAKQAHRLRNEYRTQARELMADQDERKRLDDKYPNQSFEKTMERKRIKYGLTGDEAYRDILRSSQTTNKKFDRKAGIVDESD